MSSDVIHEPQAQRFVVDRDGLLSVLEYRLQGDDGVDFSRTFVPEELRGQGIAERLVRTGLRWADQQNYRISASCWYVARILDRRRARHQDAQQRQGDA